MSNAPKARTIILTVGTTATAITGAWYGAGLKVKQDVKKDVKARAEATPADKIAHLEQTKSGLVAKRIALERKISQLEARMAGERDIETVDGGKGRRF